MIKPFRFILAPTAMALNMLVLQSIIWNSSLALIVPYRLPFAPSQYGTKNSIAPKRTDTGTRHNRNNEPSPFPFRSSSTNFRSRIPATKDDNNYNDKETPQNSEPDETTTISEKISWIFDEGGFLEDDEDDSVFDDLFLTDDEDDGYSDGGGGFIQDDNDEDGPDASLNEDDLMMLHGMYPAAATSASVGANHSSSSPSTTAGSILPTTTTTTPKTEKRAAETKDSNIPTTVSLDNILASLETDLSYFYLRDELGISEDVMWKITNEAPSVLGLKANNIRNKVHVLQSLVGFSDEEIRKLITSQPTLLQLSVKKNLSPTILYWIRQVQISKNELKTLILGCPALLKYSRSNIHGKLMFFQTAMGFSLSECRELLVSEPRLLTCSVKTGLIPRLDFLHKEVEIALPDIRKILKKNPRVLLMSIEKNLTPKCVFYFIMTLQMDTKDVGKLLLKYPQILDYNLEHHILPIHHYFLSLDFSSYEFSRIIQRYPRLITYSLVHTKRRIGYLRFELYFQADAIRRILYQCPQIVSLGQSNLESTVDFLLQTVAPGTSLVGSTNNNNNNTISTSTSSAIESNQTEDESSGLVETDDKDALAILQILIAGLPTLLPLSIEKNLRPKVEYLRAKLGQEELSSALLRMPALLGYSLENRIKPRLEAIVRAKISPGKITQAITLRQDAFEEWLGRQIRRREKKEGSRQSVPKRQSGRATTSRTTRIDSVAVASVPTAATAAAAPAVPIVDQQELPVVEKSATTAKPSTKSRTSGGKKTSSPKPTQDDDSDDNTNGGGNSSRVVEEGGKIIHWRRRR